MPPDPQNQDARDRPIESRSEDKLNRAPFANALATELAATTTDFGFVMGLSGPWGNGKTSILNMVQEALEAEHKMVVLRFNPWLFSGTEELVEHFFRELAAQLKEKDDARMRKIADALLDFGTLLAPLGELLSKFRHIPVAGSTLDRIGTAARAIGNVFKRRSEPLSAKEQRVRLEQTLREQNVRLVIMVDDIDRLRPEEIQDVMRLVRLTSDLPGTSYLLAYAEDSVIKALASEDDAEGRAYLEKIVQVVHHVPTISEDQLQTILTQGIDQALEGREYGQFDKTEWTNILHLAMLPMFQSLRDVSRYVSALPVTVDVVGKEVALVDLLAIETIRVLKPGVFSKFATNARLLTHLETSQYGPPPEEIAKRKEILQEIIKAAHPHEEAMEQFFTRLFLPTTQYLSNSSYAGDFELRWERDRRLSHPDVLRFYLNKSLPEGTLPAEVVESVFDILGHRDALRKVLKAMNDEQFDHLLGRLFNFMDRYPPASVEAAIEVIVERGATLPDIRHSMMDTGSSGRLGRVLYRLFKRIDDEAERGKIAKAVIGRLTNLWAKWEIAVLVSHTPNAGTKLVSEAEGKSLLEEIRKEVFAASAGTLAGLKDLDRITAWALKDAKPDNADAFKKKLISNDRCLVQLISSAYSLGYSNTLGDVAVTTNPKLNWKWLTELLGEVELTKRVKQLKQPSEGEAKDAVELAKKYAGGWRPKADD